MSTVTFQGNPVNVSGTFPGSGEKVASFTLCGADLSDINLSDFAGKKVVLNIFPSIDTPVCATSVRVFNEKAASKENTVVLCISADLPFATGRFCEVEGIEGVVTASFFRAPSFTDSYGVNINAGPLAGLAARAVICLNEESTVVHSELVKEITEEPNYQAALDSL